MVASQTITQNKANEETCERPGVVKEEACINDVFHGDTGLARSAGGRPGHRMEQAPEKTTLISTLRISISKAADESRSRVAVVLEGHKEGKEVESEAPATTLIPPSSLRRIDPAEGRLMEF